MSVSRTESLLSSLFSLLFSLLLDAGDLYTALFDHSSRAETEMKYLLRELEVRGKPLVQ